MNTFEKIREPFYILLICILVSFTGYLLLVDPEKEVVYDNSKIEAYKKEISEKDKSIDSLLSLNNKLDITLKMINKEKETLRKKLNEKKAFIYNNNSDSDYVFIKRYLSAEYEPLF